ncbi:MAG: helix-turn-helix transcriptional regulator [Candidatus Tyrphobacter sp.]
MRKLAALATGGGQRKDEHLLWETLLECARVAAGEGAALPIAPDELAGTEPAIRSHVSYFAGLHAYMRREYAAATWWLQRMSAPTGRLQARKLQLEAHVALARDAVTESVSLLIAASDILAREAPDDADLLRVLRTIAALASDVLSDASNFEATMPPPPRPPRFEVQRRRIAGWGHVLAAEHRAARTCFVREDLAAVSRTERLDACLDRMSLALMLDLSIDPQIAQAQVDFIKECIQGISWNDLDDFSSLVHSASTLAELGAVDEASRAAVMGRHMLERAGPRSAFAHGSLARALLDEAGALAMRSKDGHAAADSAGRAYGVFARIGFDWRAARMATVMYQASHGRRWKQRAAQHLSFYPPTAFPQILSLGLLTRREREVLYLTHGGHSVREIGQTLVLGESTVRSHLGDIRRKLGVNAWVLGASRLL